MSRSIDVVEIDGASNRGIDEIRNLREAIQYSPLHSKHKIYIIDEVHMLTPEAFNALLKTLEEPPPSVIFVFATTNPIKIPQTILSRCERFIFKRLSVREICTRLRSIAEKERIDVAERALHYIALRADGSVRDGESILEQLVSFVEGKITEDEVFKLIGFLGSEFYVELIRNIIDKKYADVLKVLNRGIEDGANPLEIYRGMVDYMRAALLVYSNLPAEFVDLSDDEIARIKSMKLGREKTMNMLEVLLNSEDLIRRSMNARVAIELLLCQLIRSVEAKKPDVNATHPVDTKQEILSILQAQSPKLAALLHHSSMEVDGKKVIINAENDFAQKQLLQSKGLLEGILNKVLQQECILVVGVADSVKQENNIEDTIRALFDGEEVR